MPFPQLRDQTRVSYVSALAGDSLSLAPPGEPEPSLHPEILRSLPNEIPVPSKFSIIFHLD